MLALILAIALAIPSCGNEMIYIGGKYPAPALPTQKLLDYGILNFTRSTIAYEENANGGLDMLLVNNLRRDPRGLAHIEGNYSQVILQNENIGQDVWTKTNCSATTQATYANPLGGTTRQLIATGAGDASVSQALGFASGTIANFAVYLRSDSGPHDVTVTLSEGANISSKTVRVEDAWLRADVILLNIASQPTAKVTLLSPSAGDKLAVWGADLFGAATFRLGHLESHFSTGATSAARGQDILKGTSAQIPSRMLTGVGGGWGFRWVPSFSIDGTQITNHEHGDFIFFSFNTGGAIQELVYGPPDGSIRDGKIWVRTTTGTPVAKSIAPLTFHRGDIVDVYINPATGKIGVLGDAAVGNGVAVNAPWAWTCNAFQVGDRLSSPNTHQLDGWISDPFPVDGF